MTNKEHSTCDLCKISANELKKVKNFALCSICEKAYKEKIEKVNMTRMIER